MDKITLIKYLVRLSQIAEEIEESHPDAAQLIDNTISDEASKIDGSPEINRDLFPPVKTPYVPENIQNVSHEITNEIANSPEFQNLVRDESNDSTVLNEYIKRKVDEVLERRK